MGRSAIALLVALCAASCATQAEKEPLAFDRASLFGMIYDTDNQPCAGVALEVDGKAASSTDIRGRFVLPDLAMGEHRLDARKEGYEGLSVAFHFLNRTDVLYLRMFSLAGLLQMAEDELDQRRWSDAAALLGRARDLDDADPVLGYLLALLAYRTDRFQDAVGHLDGLVSGGCREPHVYLLLADLYEHHLDDPERAAANLASYLDLRADPEVRKRLEGLRRGAKPGPG